MKISGWSEMTWQEKREERFKRWLTPIDIKFVNLNAEELYRERVTRFIKAIKMEEPDRVPVILPTDNFPAYHAGLDLHSVMYDPKALLKAWINFMDDFGDMDIFKAPGPNLSGKILDTLNLKTTKWPGHGLPKDASTIQIVEDEYMLFDEYDKWMIDPSDYQLRINLPRTTGLFESFTNYLHCGPYKECSWSQHYRILIYGLPFRSS